MNYAPEELLAHYRTMLVIRYFEEALDRLFGEGHIGGTSHFCRGQEASAMGAVAALDADDLVTSNHRGHGHFLAKGADPGRLMAELMGKQEGYSGGRGGSQHMADFSIGFLGSNGITAGMIPVATGAALTQKLQQTGRVVLCFFGDGACAQGAFHEAVNMGAIWDLPIIYFIENNLYAMSTRLAENFRVERLADLADGYGIPGLTVDGNDYFAVRQSTAEAVARARSGRGPTLIEARTWRACGHSKTDQCEYRTAEEEAEWAKRDPLVLMRQRLLDGAVLGEDDARCLDEQAQEIVAAAIAFARSAADPDPATLLEGLYAQSYSTAKQLSSP
ncbi:MAG: thiamine pyrophosphate-dependent dehydrogenase E1 component subunit alpha [candidate division WS1 bacterium]|nr:thiamine pyrophosphate-dependent dehydrogenase E1 component subunit alpha [candidate division WS1 bacterium]